jgi:uncharacterized protein (DUF433 family)/predicted nucleotidyltransferase
MSVRGEEYARLRDQHIQRDPKIMGGEPVIRGTRVPVRTIAALIEDGESRDVLREDYPHVPEDAYEVAVLWARANPRPAGLLPAMSAEVIEQIGVLLGKAVPPNSRVVLFGSHARGTATADSDYDVLVIEPTVDSPIQESVRLRAELDDLEVPIDVVVMDQAKADQRAGERGTMVERALREGRLLART